MSSNHRSLRAGDDTIDDVGTDRLEINSDLSENDAEDGAEDGAESGRPRRSFLPQSSSGSSLSPSEQSEEGGDQIVMDPYNDLRTVHRGDAEYTAELARELARGSRGIRGRYGSLNLVDRSGRALGGGQSGAGQGRAPVQPQEYAWGASRGQSEASRRRAPLQPQEHAWGASREATGSQRHGGHSGRGSGSRHRGGGQSASRGPQARAASVQQGSRKRRNDSAGDEGPQSKALKVLDDQQRSADMWIPGGINVQRSGYTNAVTGAHPAIASVRAQDNMHGALNFGAPGSFAALTTGTGVDALTAQISAFKQAHSFSPMGQVLSIHTAVTKQDGVNWDSRSGMRHDRSLSSTPRNLGHRGRSRTAKPTTFTMNSPLGRTEGVDVTAGSRAGTGQELVRVGTAAAASNARAARAASDAGDDRPFIDLTESDDTLDCDCCHKKGTHATGRCAIATSRAHGDCAIDPFCGFRSAEAHDSEGRKTHALQGPQKSMVPNVQIVCPQLNSCWVSGRLDLVFQKLVVERRRMAPLTVYTQDFCFVDLAIKYSDSACNGEMPPALDGMWPYTKADTVKYHRELHQFYETGMENMPIGELEGLSMDNIRLYYKQGVIEPQIRHGKYHKPSPIKFASDDATGKSKGKGKAVDKGKGKAVDKGKGKAVARRTAIDDDGDVQMGGQPTASSKAGAAADDENVHGVMGPRELPQDTTAPPADDDNVSGVIGPREVSSKAPNPEDSLNEIMAHLGANAGRTDGPSGPVVATTSPATPEPDEDFQPGQMASIHDIDDLANTVAKTNVSDEAAAADIDMTDVDLAGTGEEAPMAILVSKDDVPAELWDLWTEAVKQGYWPNGHYLLQIYQDIDSGGCLHNGQRIIQSVLKSHLDILASHNQLPESMINALKNATAWSWV